MTNPAPRPNLLLIGLRLSGKSTLARALADRRATDSLDLDDAVLQHMGYPTVAEAWQAEGEPAFRHAETESLKHALEQPGRVIALGGGTPTAPGAADAIRDAQRAGTALVVYLRCSPEELRRRMETYTPGANRPSLTGTNPLDEIESIYDARDPLYRSLADHTLENIQTLDQGLAAIEPLW